FYSTTADLSDPAVTSVEELAEAQQHFFVPTRLADPFNHSSLVEFDTDDLLPIKTEDAVQNQVHAVHDYRVLQPKQVIDPNGNRSEVAFDALSLVVGTSIMGKATGTVEGDSFDNFTIDLAPQQISEYFDAANPRPLAIEHLGTATTRVIYDLAHVPACAASIARETHVADLGENEETRVHLSFVYSDAFGREAQTKIQADPGPLEPNDPDSAPLNPRWVGTG